VDSCFHCQHPETEYTNDNGERYCIDCADVLCERCAGEEAVHDSARHGYICFSCCESIADFIYESMRDR
jgi:hypothetical protein